MRATPKTHIEWKGAHTKAREREECARSGNQQLNHMHHVVDGKDQNTHTQNRCALIQIKTDPQHDKRAKCVREREWKDLLMIFFHFLFVPSFHFPKRERKKSHKFGSSFFSPFSPLSSFSSSHFGLSHLHRFYFRLQNDVIKIKCVQADYYLYFDKIRLLFGNSFQGKIPNNVDAMSMRFQLSSRSRNCIHSRVHVWIDFDILSNYGDESHTVQMTVIWGQHTNSHNNMIKLQFFRLKNNGDHFGSQTSVCIFIFWLNLRINRLNFEKLTSLFFPLLIWWISRSDIFMFTLALNSKP